MANIGKRKKPEKQKKGAFVLMQVRDDVRALNTAVTLLSQKMKHLVRNEKILGRNLVVLNKKIRALETGEAGAEGLPENVGEQFSKFSEQVKELNEKLESLTIELNELRTSTVSQGDLKELKYVVDSINPLEYVTVEQAKEMIAKQLKKKK